MIGSHIEQRQVLGVSASGHGVDDELTIFVTVEIERARFKVMKRGEDMVTGRWGVRSPRGRHSEELDGSILWGCL
jgi:hypothetical protein